ncbi:MAG TPA: SpoIID/LytB domain-containing protein, partial [Actinomycetota bacterium]|nr:SpoIID/LytB domain-containing protein [Actinomycetota bacterium]
MAALASPRPRFRVVAVTLVLAGAACTSTPAPRADGTTSKPTTAPSSPAASATPSSEAPTSAVIRSNGGSLLVRGTYPRVASRCVRYHRPRLAARYPGTLSVKRSDDGTLALTVTLPFEDYLKGIAEVPPSWPRAALEAQAIAARSYALATTGWEGAEGEALKTPICATTSCQVYRGIPVPFDPNVRRWF